MLKRIDIGQLRVGMFIESLEGAWLNTPFAGRRFMLDNEADAQALKNSNLSGIFINTAKGLDAAGSGTSANASGETIVRAPRVDKRQKADYAKVAQAVSKTSQLLEGIFNDARTGGKVTVELVAPIIMQIAAMMQRHSDILINVTRLKDKDQTTFIHSIAVSALMIRFARHLKMDEETVRVLGMSGLLHDIGKLSVPSDILSKETALTRSEMDVMRNHPEDGYAILKRQSDMPDIVLDVCLHHHEHPDGKGYPFGLAGNEISLYARIATICDVYDAITSARPYKKPWTHQEASDWMLDQSGFFDRPLLLQFISGVLRS